jgi:hypothetical protein
MRQPDSDKANIRNRKGKSNHSPARKVGYVVVIIIMFIFLYLVRHWENWHLNFLTSDFSRCLFYIELSIYVTIAANVLFIFYDNRWFKHLVQAVTSVAGALSLIMIYVIFPFSLEDETWLKWIRIGLLVLFGLSAISIIVDLVKGLRYLVKEPEAL